MASKRYDVIERNVMWSSVEIVISDAEYCCFSQEIKKTSKNTHEHLIEYILRNINWKILSRTFRWQACVLKKPLWPVDWSEAKVELEEMSSNAVAVEKVKWCCLGLTQCDQKWRHVSEYYLNKSHQNTRFGLRAGKIKNLDP